MRKTALHAVAPSAPSCYPYENPKPCGCCRHGHTFAALELIVRRQEDGAVVKRMDAAPGGYEERR